MQNRAVLIALLARQCRHRRLVAAVGLSLLGACSSAPGPKDIPSGTEFSTQILADNTKIFTLKVHPDGDGGPNGAMRQGGRRGGGAGGEAECFPCEPGDSRRGGMTGSLRTRELDLKAIATAMIAENHFCRDGFVVLEQFHQERSRVVRGECRDSADAGDRTRFTQ